MKNSSKEIVYLDFWLFWLWQYTSRNSEYLDAYRKREEYLKDKPLEIARPGSFDPEMPRPSKKFKFYPKDPANDSSSEEILRAALEGNLSFNVIDFSAELIENLILGRFEPVAPRNEFFLRVSLLESLELARAELDYLYILKKSPKPKDEESFRETKSQLKRLRSHLAQPAGLKSDSMIRAIGLWLWDHKKQMEELTHRRFSVQKAALEIYQRFDLKKHVPEAPEYASSSLRKFERLHKKTAECIEKRAMLPMK